MQYNRPMATRRALKCPVFGSPCQLYGSMLPTYADTMKFYLSVKNVLKQSRPVRDKGPAIADLCEIVATNVEETWKKASIPVVSHKSVF